MKKIEAIIRESKLSEVKESLSKVGITAFSYWEVTALSRQKSGGHKYRGRPVAAADIKRVFISVVINGGGEEPVVTSIMEAARTGEVGDGKIFVYDIRQSYRIRTGEMGAKILTAFKETVAKSTNKLKDFYSNFNQ